MFIHSTCINDLFFSRTSPLVCCRCRELCFYCTVDGCAHEGTVSTSKYYNNIGKGGTDKTLDGTGECHLETCSMHVNTVQYAIQIGVVPHPPDIPDLPYSSIQPTNFVVFT